MHHPQTTVVRIPMDHPQTGIGVAAPQFRSTTAAVSTTSYSSGQHDRRSRVCDQCGTFETPALRFKLCGGCMVAQYCSHECQKAHWFSHKPICQYSSQKTRAKTSNRHDDMTMEKSLRSFASAHCCLLGWAAVQALHVKRLPANMRMSAFLVKLVYLKEVYHRLSISSTHVVPRSYISDPLIVSDIQRRDERSIRNGGVGTIVVVLQCGTLSQVVPIEVHPPVYAMWNSRDDWAQILSHFVEKNPKDFKPPIGPADSLAFPFHDGSDSDNDTFSLSRVPPQLDRSGPESRLANSVMNTKFEVGVSLSRTGENRADSARHSPIPSFSVVPGHMSSECDADDYTQGGSNSEQTARKCSEEGTRIQAPIVLCQSSPDTVDCPTETDPFQGTACWVAAEHALRHALNNASSISAVFERCNIPKSEYVVLAGFDESLIKAGVGYLEQIHVFASAAAATNIGATSSFLEELGEVLTPFSAILFTDHRSYRLPVYKSDGSVWEFDELVYSTASNFGDGQTTGIETSHLTVISLSQSPSSAGGQPNISQGSSGEKNGANNEWQNSRSGKGKGRENVDENQRDGDDLDDEDEDDDDNDPDDPSANNLGLTAARPAKISFAIGSKMYPVQDKLREFQTLTVRGNLTIQTTPANCHKANFSFSTRHVQFAELTFGTKRTMEMAYAQFHVRVTVNSQHENAGIEGVRPKRTTAYNREEIRSSGRKKGLNRGLTAGLKIGLHPEASISGTATMANENTTGLEKKRYTSRITEQHHDGTIEWGFDIDDPHEQETGIDMADDVLPTVGFEFVGDPKAQPPPPPERMNIEIASYWSMIPKSGTESKWIHRFLNVPRSSGDSLQEPGKARSYSNLCQIVFLDTIPSDLPPRSDYRATMHVSPGVPDAGYISYYPQVKLQPAESCTVTPTFSTEDRVELKALKHPMPTKLRLSDYLTRPATNSGGDIKSQ